MRIYRFPAKAFTDDLSDEQFIAMCKINVLAMIMKAGCGHIGSSFSALHIIVPILRHLFNPKHDVLYSSKGHDCAGLYAAYMAMGMMPNNLWETFRQPNGLPGHPDPSLGALFPFTSGSLGMGISKAIGLAMSKIMNKEPGNVYVIVGDGELQEGQCTEASCHIHKLDLSYPELIDRLSIHIDNNGWSSSTKLGEVPLAIMIDDVTTRHNTTKAAGVLWWENDPAKYHAGAPNYEDYQNAVTSLAIQNNLNANILDKHEIAQLPIDTNWIDAAPIFGDALFSLMEEDPKVVVLTADLVKECGLAKVFEKFPDRCFDVGIREQHMVSMASGLAAGGLKPVVVGFACFLLRRAFEQIYINSTENRPIYYVGTMAGPLKNNPGSSHTIYNAIELTEEASIYSTENQHHFINHIKENKKSLLLLLPQTIRKEGL